MMRIAALALTTLALFTACSENGISNLGPGDGVGGEIAVSPDALVYGLLAGGEEEILTFEITNVGTAALRVDELVLAGSDSFILIDPPSDFLLPEGASELVDVLFTPMGANDQLGHVTVLSDDASTPEERVDLSGEGAVPELAIDPETFDFGADFVGCGGDVEIGLENVGTDDLIIDEITYEDPDGQLALTALRTDSQVLPLTLAPGEATEVFVNFEPTFEVAALGTLKVHSNEPRGWVSATQEAEGIFATVLDERFVVPSDPPVDILFAVDQSGSMDGHSASLGANFSGLITALSQVTNSWRVGVSTLGAGCFNQGVLDATTTSLASKFAAAVSTGSGSEPNTEKLFRLTQNAMGQTGYGQCNSGFLRPDALLHIILVSDEKEQSGIGASTFVTNMQSYKASPALVKVSGIICSPSGCGHADGTDGGYKDAVTLTGGVRMDVMGSGWANYAQQIAAASLTGINRFELSQTAAPDSLVVSVNGTEQATDWHFDAATNEVVFDVNPPEGADIDIEYGVLVPCN